MAMFGHVTVDSGVRFDKRAKSVHRYDIVDTRGPITLTVPIAKPRSSVRPTWDDVPVSTHDQWWHQHRVTLESAYGRTPYFEFIIDRFTPLIADPSEASEWPSALSIARQADKLVRDFLGFDNVVNWQGIDDAHAEVCDFRKASFSISDMIPYRQIRASRLGFVPNLSILDLIFNLGPEAAFYLRDLGSSLSPHICLKPNLHPENFQVGPSSMSVPLS